MPPFSTLCLHGSVLKVREDTCLVVKYPFLTTKGNIYMESFFTFSCCEELWPCKTKLSIYNVLTSLWVFIKARVQNRIPGSCTDAIFKLKSQRFGQVYHTILSRKTHYSCYCRVCVASVQVNMPALENSTLSPYSNHNLLHLHLCSLIVLAYGT